MFRPLLALTITLALGAYALPAPPTQGLKSGPQADDTLPGAFQPLNINGPFAGRYHCLVTEFRLNPVAVVFVRLQSESVDGEVKKLLEALDRAAVEKQGDTGLRTFVVFLSSQARGGATEGKVDAKEMLAEAKNREKLVNSLKEFSRAFKSLVVSCCPPETVAQQYRLADTAEVTVVVYASHHVFSSLAFAAGQLQQAGIDNVLRGVDAMLQAKPAIVK